MTHTSTISIRHDPGAGTLTAASTDSRSRLLLEQAGFVRHDATGLHRPRRDTAHSTVQRLAADATRLLTAAGYDVLRLYSEQEQKEQVVNGVAESPVMTRGPGTIWRHHVHSDLAAGHLVVHARLSKSGGPAAFLAAYPGLGDAAVLAADNGSFFGVTVYHTLDEARAALGIAETETPEPTARRTAATTRTAPAEPAPAVPEPVSVQQTEVLAGRSR